MDGIMSMRRLLDGVHLLYILWNNDAGDTALCFCNTDGTVNQMTYLHRARGHIDVFASNVFKEGDEVNLLLIVTADGGACGLSNDCYHWLMIHLGIIQTIQ